jgi:hypothetical protein
MIKHILVLATLFGPGCLWADEFSHDGSGYWDVISKPTPDVFSVCFNHSCQIVESHSITRQEWQRFVAPLETPGESAEKERDAVARAIAIMEEIVGPKIGREQDLGRNLRGFGKAGQMDCVDESTNTTTYLYMLEQAGYLKWHTLVDSSTRYGIFVGMPHTTAVIEDINTHTHYAVDSWFFDNGMPPAIIKLSAWKKGWDPGDTVE